jgi:hypothetical protein
MIYKNIGKHIINKKLRKHLRVREAYSLKTGSTWCPYVETFSTLIVLTNKNQNI